MRCALVCYIAALFLASQAGATTVIDTLSGWGGTSGIKNFGEPNSATYGQTITAPGSDTVLSSFTFLVNDFLNTDFVEFEAYVYAWDGAKATGPALFQSNPLSTTNNGGSDGFESFTIHTGGISLIGGAEYVLFFSASNLFDGEFGSSEWAYRNADVYSGGQFVFQDNGSNFSSLTSNSWSNRVGEDLAFTATFLPEPTTALLLAPALAALARCRHRRA